MKHNPLCSRTRFVRLLCAALFLFCSSVFTSAEAAGGMVLLTEPTSTRAIALESTTLLGEPFQLTSPVKFSADNRTRLIFFAMNLDLLAGESAKALSADAEDASKNRYELTVEDVRPVPGFEWMSAITVRLSDNLASDPGDVLVRINLHGVASNRVRIGLGHKGGGPVDDSGAVPTPAPSVAPAPTPTPTPNPYTGAATTPDTVRFLEQATFGPTASEITRVQGMGFRAYLNEQFSATPSSYPTLTLMPTDSSQGCSTGSAATCVRDNYSSYPHQMKFFQNALNTQTGNDQLRQRVAWALHQIFVVSGNEINMPSWLGPYLQKIDQNAFGNFRTLLNDITLNAAMGLYLDMLGNNRSNPNENYAREVGDGRLVIRRDAIALRVQLRRPVGVQLVEADREELQDFARVFTGWTLAAQKQTVINGVTFNVFNYQDPMRVTNENNHDTAQKVLLNGQVLPAGQTAATELNAALDNIFNHPNVGPFIGKQLIQHLVTSNPSPAYIERVASVFNNNCAGLYPDSPCTGARGDLKAVVRAILLDPEARGDAKTDPSYGRLREPAQFIANIIRVANAPSDGFLRDESINLSQDVLRPPTVFNYYPADYIVPGTELAGPQFGILSTSTALRRANFVNRMITSGIPAGTNAPTGTPAFTLSSLTGLASDSNALVNELDRLMLHNTMPAAMKSSIVTAVNTVSSANTLDRARLAFYLVATSSQYQVER